MIRTPLVIVSMLIGLSVAGPRAQQPLPCETQLTEEAIKQLMAAGSPSGRLRQLIASCGLDLALADAELAERQLRQIGVPAAALTALAPPANAVGGATWVSPFDRRPMAFVAAGSMRMGSPPSEAGRDEDEVPHEVRVSRGFWIDVAEVSNEAYRRFVVSRPEWQKGRVSAEMAGSAYLLNWQGTDYPAGMGDAPVEFVSWHAARAYAAWAGKRLPTELEWEFAARAGTATRFWWGDDFNPQRVATGDQNTPADQLPMRTNRWGVRDMTGSVWEWTVSLFRPYPYLASDGRESPSASGVRAIRGGSRANGATFLRIANRSSEDPTAASDMLGFRCAR